MRAWRVIGVVLLVAMGSVVTLFPTADPPANLSWSRAPFTDEGLKSYNARNYVLSGRWTFDDNDTYPGWHLRSPLFTGLLVTSFKIYGVGLVQARLVGMFFGLLLPPAVALLLWRNGLRKEAFVAWLLLGSSYLYIMYARLCMFDLALATFLTLALCGLTWGLGDTADLGKSASRRHGMIQITLTLMAFAYAFLTKPIVLVMLPTIVLGLWTALRHRGISPRRLLIPVGLVILAMLAFGGLAMLKWKGAGGYVVARLSLDSLRGIIASAAGVVVDIDGGGQIRGPAEFWRQTGLLSALALGGFAMTLRNWTSARPVAKLSVVWIVNYGLFLATINYKPNRYYLPLLPPLAVLAATFIVAAWHRAMNRRTALRPWAAGVVAGMLAIQVGINASQYIHWASARRYDIVDASHAIQALTSKHAAVMEGTWATPLAIQTSLRCYPNGEGANSTPAQFEQFHPDFALIEREGQTPEAIAAAMKARHASILSAAQVMRTFRLGRYEVVLLKLEWKPQSGALGLGH